MSKYKDNSVIYHFTCEFHLPAISRARCLVPKENDITFDKINISLVWLTTSPLPENMGLLFDSKMPDDLNKTHVRFTIRKKPYMKQWDKWSEGNDTDKDWKQVLIDVAEAQDTYKTWYVSEKDVPIDDVLLIENLKTGKVYYKNEDVGFVRSFDVPLAAWRPAATDEIFEQLKVDVDAGEIFPTIRKGFVDFYCKGGLLYRYNGVFFIRNPAYEKYSEGCEGLSKYETAKKQCENRFAGKDGSAKERQLLDSLNCHTFDRDRKTKVVVLDIEVRLNGIIGGTKKCDIVLFNTETKQIMFIEGKIFKDKRVNVAVGFTPEVINQVNLYTASIDEQAEEIVKQYGEHVKIINELFGTEYDLPTSLIPTAKLLIYETPIKPNINGQHVIKTVNDELGANNVAWYIKGERPSIDEIWDALCE